MATVNLAPDLERDLSAELLPFLLKRNFAWEIPVDNIASCTTRDEAGAGEAVRASEG